jgi:hypothetical protein
MKSPEDRLALEKEVPSLVAARDKAVTAAKRQQLQKETAQTGSWQPLTKSTTAWILRRGKSLGRVARSTLIGSLMRAGFLIAVITISASGPLLIMIYVYQNR